LAVKVVPKIFQRQPDSQLAYAQVIENGMTFDEGLEDRQISLVSSMPYKMHFLTSLMILPDAFVSCGEYTIASLVV